MAIIEMRKHHRTAHAAAEGRPVQIRLRGCCGICVRDCVPLGILVIPKRRTVEQIGSTLGGYDYLSGIAVFRPRENAVRSNFSDSLS